MRIVVDVMGGDHGPEVLIEGVRLALEDNSNISELFLVGRENEIHAAMKNTDCRDRRVHIVHASEVLEMEDKPVEGLRRKKDCSILRAVDLVKEGKADAIISTGNTGGIVAASTIRLRPIAGVDRPAIATVIPAPENEFVLIDSGASVECKPHHLLHFAVMGKIYSQQVLGYKNPRVGILSNGTETNKGTELTQEAYKLCQMANFNFIGNVEGHDLFHNQVDVVVCDGFIGNIVLKTIESFARGLVGWLKDELSKNPKRMLGAMLASNALRTIKRRMDPDGPGGAPLLGLNGTVMKVHGSAKAKAMMNAIRVTGDAVAHQINQSIREEDRSSKRADGISHDQGDMSNLPERNFTNPRAKHGFKARTCSIASVGSYVPQRILTNADLEKLVETSDDWITTRTGIKERRIAASDEFTSDMAAKAAALALERAQLEASQIDLIVVATITPDMPFPSTACLVQQKIGAYRAAAFDIEAACSGFIFALEIAQQFIMSHTYDTVLVIGAEKLSSIINWKDRNTCVLFGDGAGAAILQNRPGSHGLLTACMGSDGNKADLLCMPGGGSRMPPTPETLAAGHHYLRMDGKETFKNAIHAMCTAATEALRRCEVDITQIKCVIPHQANLRIIDAVCDRIGATPEQRFVNLDKYGNTSAASVAIALDEAVQAGRIERGDLVLLVVFGAGLTWGAAVIEW